MRALLLRWFRVAWPHCESCGAPADIRLRDRSTWCFPCHGSALTLGYDRDGGRLL